MKNLQKIASFFLIAVVLFGCSSRNSEMTMATDEFAAFEVPPPVLSQSVQKDIVSESEYQRKIRKTGELRFQTSDYDRTKTQIHQVVADLKGYVESDKTSNYGDSKENSLVIRVPSENFDSLLTKVALSASKVDVKNVKVDDVTEEFIDLDKRLGTKKELEQRYIQLLQKANKVEEILKIEEQIGILREEIESVEGRLKYLSNQVAFSMLNVTFYEKTREYNFWNRMGEGFVQGWEVLLTVFVAIANLWAIILLVIGVFFLIRYWRKRRKSKIIK